MTLRCFDRALRTFVLFDLMLLGEGAHAEAAQVQLMGTHVLVDVGHRGVFLVAHFALVDFFLFWWSSTVGGPGVWWFIVGCVVIVCGWY